VAAPTQFTTAQLDAESPWTETPALLIKTTFDHLLNYSTDKIQTDLVSQDSAAASCIGQGETKTTTDEVTQAATAGVWYLKTFGTANTYSFRVQAKSTQAGALSCRRHEADTGQTSYANSVAVMQAATAGTISAQVRYFQASPPYSLGKIPDWGLFVWAIRNSSSGEIKSAALATDAPWGHVAKAKRIPKDHPGAVALRPHPFLAILNGWKHGENRVDEVLPGEEIVLFDLRHLGEMVEVDLVDEEARNLRGLRDYWIGMGIDPLVLDHFESSAKAKREKPTRTSKEKLRVPLFEKMRMDAEADDNSLLPVLLQHPSLTKATKEIESSDRKHLDCLKCIPGFGDTVRVVCAP
jgi:hypothetical protein